MTQIAGKTVVVTGAARGLGRALALAMARLGANPVVCDIDAEGLAKVVEELRSITGRPAYGLPCDVSDREQVYRTAAEVKQRVGPVHILVNNAGIVSGRRFLECTDEQVERTLCVNAMGLFWTVRAFLPEMIAAGSGHLVTIASAAGLIGVSRLADYAASKWAAVGFDESLRMELRQLAPAVRTTVVCPYYVNTGMFHGVRTRVPWLLPILKEEVVVRRIVRAIQKDQARLMLPWSVNLLALLRLLPVRLFDAAADLLGINRSMDHFVGRDGAARASGAPGEQDVPPDLPPA